MKNRYQGIEYVCGSVKNELIVSLLSFGGMAISIGLSDFIWPFLPPYMGVIPNQKMAFIFPISCIFALIFPIFMKFFPKYAGKGSFQKSQIKSLGLRR